MVRPSPLALAALLVVIFSMSGWLMGPLAHAQVTTANEWSDRSRITSYIDDQRQLERDLLAVSKRGEYRAFIEKKGYLVTSVNEDSDHKLEFEVVKRGRSHEILLGFERERGAADAIDVTNNVWLAEATRQALDKPGWRPERVEFDPEAAAKVRDSNHLGEWTAEKKDLELALPVGKTVPDYQSTLQEKGYQITASNDTLPTYAEYEIVKGERSFELQIERDVTTGRAVSVDVEANIWQAKDTKEALGAQ
ncbi:MAG: hypothetical protein AB8C46_13850 [Burkholderiaceae bacterium]